MLSLGRAGGHEHEQGLEGFLRSLQPNCVGGRKKWLSNLHGTFPVAPHFSVSLVQATGFWKEREERIQLLILGGPDPQLRRQFVFLQAARKNISLKLFHFKIIPGWQGVLMAEKKDSSFLMSHRGELEGELNGACF